MINKEVVYAKSFPCQTIKEHNETLTANMNLLKETYGVCIEYLIPTKYKSIFWDILSLVIKYHDLGKLNVTFQNKIRKSLSLPKLCDSEKNLIPHSFLSPAFIIKDEIDKYEKEIIKVIIQSIVFHHEGDYFPNFEELEKVIKYDLENRRNLLKDIINPPDKLWTGYERFYRKRITSKDAVYVLYLLVKGLLHRIDHSASAFTSIEIKDDSLSDKVLFYLSKKGELREIQRYANNNQDKNLIIVASTGIGKTESGLLWAGKEKTFITLPLRVSVNSIFNRIANEKEINYEATGLLHSSSLDYLDYEGFETPFEIYKNSRQLSYQVNVSTIDQLFTFPLKFRGYEKILSTLLYSKVIIDEIQSYEPKIAAIILSGLRDIYKLGGKFLVMTATLPQIYLDILRNWNVEFEYAQFFTEKRRHKIKILNKTLEHYTLDLKSLSSGKKVLVIVNTIKKATKLFRDLIDQGCMPKMLHSMFIGEDRKKLEEDIFSFSRGGENGIWITTQLAETSLDIDFDVLFTELSSLDSLFQRLGRIYRQRAYGGEEPNVYIFTEDCSGIGGIYDNDIFNLSKEEILKFDEKLLEEQDKVDMVKRIYSKEKLVGTKYYEEFKKALRVLENLLDYELDKTDAQGILRDIYSVKVIPVEIYEMYKNEITDMANIILNVKDILKRIKAEQFINDKSLDIPFFKVKSSKVSLTPINKIKGIYIINCNYNQSEGLILDETISNII